MSVESTIMVQPGLLRGVMLWAVAIAVVNVAWPSWSTEKPCEN